MAEINSEDHPWIENKNNYFETRENCKRFGTNSSHLSNLHKENNIFFTNKYYNEIRSN